MLDHFHASHSYSQAQAPPGENCIKQVSSSYLAEVVGMSVDAVAAEED